MSKQPDILELFGLPPMDPKVSKRIETKTCPFTNSKCTQVKGNSSPQGVCVVSQGSTRIPVVICPNRFYGADHAVLKLISSEVFGASDFVIGGTRDEIEEKLFESKKETVVAFGANSLKKISVQGKSKVEFNWILQNYNFRRKPTGFIGVEFIVIETTGSYRGTLDAYKDSHASGIERSIPPSEHGINWPSLNKKILPELIRKSLVLSQTNGCEGSFVVIPEIVYQRIEYIFEDLLEQSTTGADIMSIRTFIPDLQTISGVKNSRGMNFKIKDVAAAFYGQPDEKACEKLEKTLKELL